jgi:CBS domain containing-hemolysin-like protein
MSAVPTIVALVLVAAAVAIAAVMSSAQASVVLVGRGRAHRLVEADVRGASDLERILERPGRLLAASALVRSVAYAGVAVGVTWAVATTYEDLASWVSLTLGVLVSVLVVFTLGEALPRTIAIHNPERIALAVAPVARPVTSLLSPVTRALSWLWGWAASVVGRRQGPGVPWVTAREHDELFSENGEEREEEAASERLVEAMADFSGRIVREVMVPRTDMVCLDDKTDVAEALRVIEEEGFSRLPVFHDSLDDVRGVLYAKDLLVELGRGCERDAPVVRLVRRPFFVPETKLVRELLVEMRRKSHIAVVADEYGGTAGLVTIEDLLEEIVGDIFDEYDLQVPMLVQLGDDRYLVDARMSVDELNEQFATAIEREADSVGGLFIEEAGHIPDAGESVEVEGLRFTVEDLEGNRIRQLVVESAGGTTDEEGRDD